MGHHLTTHTWDHYQGQEPVDMDRQFMSPRAEYANIIMLNEHSV